MSRNGSTVNEAVVLSGLTELALGALTGWPYALAISDPEAIRKLGVRSTPRLRQWHLDLIALGSLSVLVGTAVPDLPRRIGYPLAVGCWTNASSFMVLTFRPEATDHPVYRAGVTASFTAVSWAFTSLAALAFRRRRGSGRARRGRASRTAPPRRRAARRALGLARG